MPTEPRGRPPLDDWLPQVSDLVLADMDRTFRDPHFAQDVTQEAARRAVQKETDEPGFFQSPEHLRNWMCQVGRNYGIDQRRRTGRCRRLPEGDLDGAVSAFRQDRPARRDRPRPDGPDGLSLHLPAALRKHFERLTPRQQEIVRRKCHNQTFGTIAALPSVCPPDGRSGSAHTQKVRKEYFGALGQVWSWLVEAGFDPDDLPPPWDETPP